VSIGSQIERELQLVWGVTCNLILPTRRGYCTCKTFVCSQHPQHAAAPTNFSTQPSPVQTSAWVPQSATTAPRGICWSVNKTGHAQRAAFGQDMHLLANVRNLNVHSYEPS